MDSTLEAVASDKKDMKQYQDRQRGAFTVLIVGAGAVGAAIDKAVTYLATRWGLQGENWTRQESSLSKTARIAPESPMMMAAAYGPLVGKH